MDFAGVSLIADRGPLLQSRTTRQLDYFVDGALGDDAGSGDFQNPFRTISRAITAADETNNPGDNNIFVRPGFLSRVSRHIGRRCLVDSRYGRQQLGCNHRFQ